MNVTKSPAHARFTVIPQGLLGQAALLLAAAVCGFYVSVSFGVTRLIAIPSAVVFSAITFAALRLRYGSRLAAYFVFLAGVFGFLAEVVGTITEFPFGFYYYTSALGESMFGLVPTAMAFAWAPMLAAGLYVARRVSRPRLVAVLLGAAAVVAVDLVMDPGTAKVGYWIWPDGGFWYGVPLTNFFGWFLVSAVGIAFAGRLVPPGRLPPEALICVSVIVAFWGGFAVFHGWWLIVLLAVALLGLSLRETAVSSPAKT